MPVLEVEVIGEIPPEIRRGLAARIADGAAAVLDAEPASVWVRLRFTPLENYAENAQPDERSALGPETPERPVFVNLLQRACPSRDAMRREVRALAAAIGAASGRPAENVHVFYEPPGEGRVAFGGNLVE